MKYLVIWLIVFLAGNCSPKRNTNKKIEIIATPVTELDVISIKKIDPETIFLTCLDSVNQYQPGMKLPNFLYNPLLDYEHPWLSDHHTWSIRKMIFDSIKTPAILKAIINSNDLRLRQVIDSNVVDNKMLLRAIPYTKLSNYEFAKMRLSELNKN